MPDGTQDQVQVSTPDGKVWTIPKQNLAKAQQRGAKLVTAQKTTGSKDSDFTKGFGESVGLKPEPGKSLSDLKWKQVGSQLYQGAKTGITSEISSLRHSVGEDKGIPGIGTPYTDALAIPHLMARGAEGLASGLENAYSEARKGNVSKAAGSALGTTAQIAGGMEASKISGGVASKIPEVGNATKSVARELVGVGDKDIAKAIQDSADKATKTNASNADALTQHAERVDQIIKSTSDKIAEVNKKRIEASKGETASKVKRDALTTEHGPVYKHMNQMADLAQENVQDVDAKVRAVEGAKWSQLGRTVNNSPVNWAPVQQAVQSAEQNILKGSPENIALFKNILKEGQEGDDILNQASVFKNSGAVTDVKEVMRSMSPQARDKFLAEMKSRGIDPLEQSKDKLNPDAAVDFDKARGYFTELGQKMQSGSIPNDVRRALKSVQETVDGEIARTVTKAGGKDALLEYRTLKNNWRDYMQAFYDKDSPLRKLKEGQDPGDKLRPIVGDEGQRAIALFGKYKSLGADVTTMGRLRSLHTSLEELPGGGGSIPSAVEKPKIPGAPKTEAVAAPLSPEEARLAKVKQAAQSYAHPPSRWELMFPPLMAYRLSIKKMLQSERVQEFLAKDKK
jgi:hypothetical protein